MLFKVSESHRSSEADVSSGSPSSEQIEELWVVCGLYTIVWRADLYQKEALRQLSDTAF